MPTIPHSSKTNYKESAGVIPNLTLGSALRAVAVGVTPWGPIAGETIGGVVQKYVEVPSWPEYKRKFGNFDSLHTGQKYAWAFFKTGGQILYFARTVHFTDPTDAATATSARATITIDKTDVQSYGTVLCTEDAPYELDADMDLDFSVNGGGTDTCTFDAVAATIECGTAETYDLSTGGETLTVKINQGTVQTITFQTAMFGTPTLATAEEVAAAMNAQLLGAQVYTSTGDTKVTIDSDQQGTGAYVEVTGGTANSGILNFSTSPVQGTSTAGVANIKAVTIAEIKAAVEAQVSLTLVTDVGSNRFNVTTTTVGAGGSIQVEATSTADTIMGLDNTVHDGSDSGSTGALTLNAKYVGLRGDNIDATVAAATNGDSNYYDLVILEDSVIQERFYNLDDTNVEDIVNHVTNGSDLVQAVSESANNPDAGTESLTGGDDGLTSLDDNDYAGDAAAGTGIRAFDSLKGFRLALTDRETAPHVKAFHDYLGTTRKAMGVLLFDPPTGSSYSTARTYMSSNSIKNYGEFAAGYWPYTKWPSPDRNIFGTNVDEVEFPSSAAVAGRCVYVSGQRDAGFADEAANKGRGTFPQASDIADDYVNKEWVRDLIYPDLLNPIRSEEGQVFNDGVLVCKVDGNFPTLAQRITACETAHRILDLLDALRHYGLSEDGLKERRSKIEAILKTLTKAGAYASKIDDEAWYVDDSGNTPAMRRQLRYKVKVGIATIDPGEFNDFELGYNEQGLLYAELISGA